MKISASLPPNYKEIVAAFDLSRNDQGVPVFTYGDTLHNPSGAPIPVHLMKHEEIHSKQQGYSNHGAAAWWKRFIEDPAFRLEQELEAYGTQYLFARKSFSIRNATQLLHVLATDLSSPAYGSMLSYGEAASKIRNWAKDMEQQEAG